MDVALDLDQNPLRATLRDPDDFRRFALVLLGERAPATAPSDLESRSGELGIAWAGEHAWIPVALVRRLAGEAASPEWEQQLAGMVDFARSRGWYDEGADAIRAHVE